MGQKLLCFLALLALSNAAVNREHSSKSFSLFSVVTFPNNECTTTGTNPMTGVCQTTEECDDNGGSASGNCASGFGVCCMYTTSKCGDTISNNITYIQNENYPSGFSTASKTCEFKVSGDPSICQIRLDFDTAMLEQPDANGVCADTVAVTSPSSYNPPTLCGTLTGQHMYIETARQNPGATININTGAATTSRTWKIKVSMIECMNPSRAPTDCVQYFTGTGGIIESFNNPTGMIKNQEYDVCIRQIDGFCAFEVAEANSGTPDAFDLPPLAADVAKIGTTDCVTAWVVIPTSGVTDRHCGRKLSTVSAQTVSGTVMANASPFKIGVVAANVNQEDNSGFKLRYTQTPCDN